jgi:hypothetical protein
VAQALEDTTALERRIAAPSAVEQSRITASTRKSMVPANRSKNVSVWRGNQIMIFLLSCGGR